MGDFYGCKGIYSSHKTNSIISHMTMKFAYCDDLYLFMAFIRLFRRVLQPKASRTRTQLEAGLFRPSAYFGRQGNKTPKARPRATLLPAPQAEPGKPLQCSEQRDLCLQARYSHADARVCAGGKRKMTIGLAGDVEKIRLRKLLRITIGCADAQSEIGPCLQRDAADGDPFADQPVSELVGALQPQALLDRRSRERGILAQALRRSRRAQQQVQPVGDDVGGCVVTRIQQEHAVLQQLVLRQFLLAQQACDQIHVRPGVPAPLADQFAQVVRELADRLVP